jgi:YidC/Oxa1 family membrane protein insertase
MEKRLLLFFAVTFLIVSLWWRIFPPPSVAPESVRRPPVDEPVGAPDVPPAAEAEPPEIEEPEQEPGKPGRPRKEEEASLSKAAAAEERVVIETEVSRFELSNRGGRLLSARLLGYRDDRGEPYELVDRSAIEHSGNHPLDVELPSAAQTAEVKKALFTVERSGPASISGGESTEVLFSWADGKGLEVTKRLRFESARYGFDVDVSVKEHGRELAKGVIYGPGIGNEVKTSQYVGVEKGVVVSRGEVALFAAADLEEAGTGVSVTAAGVSSHYFAALMLPRGDGLYGSRLSKLRVPQRAVEVNGGGSTKEHEVITAVLESPRDPARFHLFLGPKKLEALEALRPGLSRIIEFGNWMRYPALLLRSGLMWFHERVGNFGWAIVLLTGLINLALVPLKHYSFVSMRRMQKLAPQIQRIRERYKSVKATDPRAQKMNQEIMGVYKEHKVNPVSGCLPMLLMIPFFFAFYRLLMASIELRQAPFLGWIQDLSQHDPYFVLPILMGLSQIAIQKMTPQTSADPVQAKLMQFMPIVFTFILAWAPSGLVLYWFSNNLVSMGQQVATNRLLELGEGRSAGGARKGK